MMYGRFFNAGIHIRKAAISVEEPENVVWEGQVNDIQITHNSLSARSVSMLNSSYNDNTQHPEN